MCAVHACCTCHTSHTSTPHTHSLLHRRWVWDCVFSVDAAYLVTASSDHMARLWDLSSGETIRTYTGHSKALVCCALNDSAIDGCS